jgi:GT2 family glycosyltransferase
MKTDSVEDGDLDPMESFPSPWVRVVIVNYNGGDYIQNCVNALAAQSMTAFEAVIVDNASTDGSADKLDFPDTRFHLLRADRNLGFAAGSNLGAKSTDIDAKTEWLAMLNPDTVADQDWLKELRAATLRHPEASLFGSTQIMADDPTILDGFGDAYSIYGIPWRSGHGWPVDTCPDDDCRVFAPCAAAALYRRDLFESLGGFDEDFFCYLEDVDFGFRARLFGHECIQVRRAIVHHFGSAISGRTSDFTLFHSYRNRVWLLLKNVPPGLLLLMFPVHFASLIWLGFRTRHLQPWRPRWRGVWAARKGLGNLLAKRRDVQSRRVISSRQLSHMLIWDRNAVQTRSYACL